MVARVTTVAFQGIEAVPVDVQVQITAGNPTFALENTPKGPVPSPEDITAKLGAFSSASDGTGDTSGDSKRERRGRRG